MFRQSAFPYCSEGSGCRRAACSLLALTACLLTVPFSATTAVYAGPTLETTESVGIGAQATFNNSWAQTFEATGSMTVDGASTQLAPFQQVNATSVELPTSGLAELTATVSNLTVRGGDMEAAASVDPTQRVGGATNIPNNVVLNNSATDGLPALRITPGTTESSVVGASIIGTNIGTEVLQVTGSLNTTVINTLTAF